MNLTPPPPPTGLARYRQLSPKAGVHVSPIQLGAMSIGDKWADTGFGAMDKESSFKLLDAYYEKGGNFIDTANMYQNGSSEEFIGEWMEQKKNRDQLVIATKYTGNVHMNDPSISHKVTFMGNSTKSLHISLEASLKRLRTTYVDILYLHVWDWATSIEEVMNALHAVVMAGKVLYLGISDTPAWIVAQANQYARDHGKTPFSIYQGKWNVLERSFEREIIPMALAHGLALAPWDVLCTGKLRSDEEDERRRKTGENGRSAFGSWERTEEHIKMSRVLQEIGKELGTEHVSAVAIAYVMQKTPYVFPIIGGRKVEHLSANLDALEISLTPEHIKRIEEVKDFDPGFPMTMVGPHDSYGGVIASSGHLEPRPFLRPIKPTPTRTKGQ